MSDNLNTNPDPKQLPGAGKAVSKGSQMSPDDVALFQRFREKFLPDTCLQTYDSFAKWLFGLTVTIAALGAGLSNAAFEKLTGWGVCAYVFAILFAGFGLAFAVFATFINFDSVSINWSSPEEMYVAARKILSKKGKWVCAAAIMLGLSLIAAGLAPGLSAWSRIPAQRLSGITYSFASDTIEATLTMGKNNSVSQIGISIFQKDAKGQETLLGSVSEMVDSSEEANLQTPKYKVSDNAVSLQIASQCQSRQKIAECYPDVNIPISFTRIEK